MISGAIQIICKEGETSFLKQLLLFCPIWQDIFENDQIIIDLEIDVEMIKKIEKFFVMHSFDKNQIVCQLPISSNNLIDNIDSISYKFMREDLNWNDNIENKEQYQDQAKQLYLILNLTYKLNCQTLQDIIQTALATPFYLAGDNEESFKAFSIKWGIYYPFTPMQQVKKKKYFLQRTLVEDNQPLFNALNKKRKEQQLNK